MGLPPMRFLAAVSLRTLVSRSVTEVDRYRLRTDADADAVTAPTVVSQFLIALGADPSRKLWNHSHSMVPGGFEVMS
ncbi:MAG: hypothetical protein ABL904_23890 [Hyphomicrobiaceae bacterium]